MKSLSQYWYEANPVLRLLLPLSWLYCLLVFIRRGLYRLNIIRQRNWQTPVVVVGNIVAGGSGKTPLLIALCDYLRASGYRPGVVSRGYGGSVRGVRQLQPEDSATLVGDEPLMIARRCDVPVVVGADRPAAVDHLLDNNRCDVVLSDDGLQHYRMGRAFEIAVVDAQRGLGNGFCLPAGPLREPASRLAAVDMAVLNGRGLNRDDLPLDTGLFYTLEVDAFTRLDDSGESESADYFRDKTVHAVAGIGNPARFFEQLRTLGIPVTGHAFADHHRYRAEDFSGWSTECIIMTEKDAVKCRQLEPALADAWVLRVSAVFSPALKQHLDSKLLPLAGRRRH